MELHAQDIAELKLLCNCTGELPQSVTDKAKLYFKAWQRRSSGPMAPHHYGALITIAVESGAVELSPDQVSGWDDVEPGTPILYQSGTQQLVGTFVFPHKGLSFGLLRISIQGDSNPETDVDADFVSLDIPAQPPAPLVVETFTTTEVTAEELEPEPELTGDESLSDEPAAPRPSPNQAQMLWSEVEVGTRVMVAVPGQEQADGELVLVLGGDSAGKARIHFNEDDKAYRIVDLGHVRKSPDDAPPLVDMNLEVAVG
jgi:hypothetical protein